jgi:hypothetical protein
MQAKEVQAISVQGVMAMLARLPSDAREAALAALRRGVLLGAPTPS